MERPPPPYRPLPIVPKKETKALPFVNKDEDTKQEDLPNDELNSGRLTNSELEQLRRVGQQQSDYAKEAFKNDPVFKTK